MNANTFKYAISEIYFLLHMTTQFFKYKSQEISHMIKVWLVFFLLNGISTFVSYLMPKPYFSKKNSSDAI